MIYLLFLVAGALLVNVKKKNGGKVKQRMNPTMRLAIIAGRKNMEISTLCEHIYTHGCTVQAPLPLPEKTRSY